MSDIKKTDKSMMINQDSEDIAILYELAMAIGKSLDLKENCREFCKILTRRKGFSYIGIWLWEKNFSFKDSNTMKKAVLVFSVPAFKSLRSSISTEHKMFKKTVNSKILYEQADQHNLEDFLLEKHSGTGSMAIFPLRDFGAIQILSPVWGPDIPTKEFNQLSHILKRFALSIKACLDHSQASKLLEVSKMESIGTLAGGIAHDFNNILTPVLGFINLGLADIETSKDPQKTLKKVEEYLKLIKKSSLRAANLVKQILNYCRKRDEDLEILDLREIIMDSIELLRATAPPSIKIMLTKTAPLVVRAAKSHLYQIIMNICSNAIKAVGKAGNVIISAEIEDLEKGIHNMSDHLEISPGKYVHVKISDTGCGIPKEIAKRIFDPFFTTNEIGSGTGLGLATAYNLTKFYHGTVKISETGSKGTVFSVYLPCCSHDDSLITNAERARPRETIKKAHEIPDIPTNSIRLLFVDDEKMLLNVAEATFKRMDIEFELANSGKEALKAFLKRPEYFNIVVTDYLMDDINGDEIAKQIREANPAVNIIITTGFSENFTEKDAIEAGASMMLEKPYDFFELLKIIHSQIKKQGQ